MVTSRIAGLGLSLPPRVVTNAHFEAYLETNDEWIKERTGISERRWIEPGTSTSELAAPASRHAIEAAGLTPDDIDAVIVATVTPDMIFPSTASRLQAALGIRKGFAFDLNAVCTGFVYALTTANSLIKTGQANHALVVGVDIFSTLLNPQDRGTCILFGDGAGAAVVSRTDATPQGPGILETELHCDGRFGSILQVPQGTAHPVTAESLQAGTHYLTMNGREVFKIAVRALAEVSRSVLEKAGVRADEVSWFVSHQANDRILRAMAEQLEVPHERVLRNVSKYGNTSAASVPMLLAEASQEGKIRPGDLVLISAVGGGMTWGAVLVRW